MGRYNLNAVTKLHILSSHDYGTIFAVGAWVYGCSFLLNGPLANRFGGRRTILVAAFGSATMNALMALAASRGHLRERTCGARLLLALRREHVPSRASAPCGSSRSTPPGSTSASAASSAGSSGSSSRSGSTSRSTGASRSGRSGPSTLENVFAVPAVILYVFWALTFLTVKDTPGKAGHPDFDTGDASSGDTSAGPEARKGLGFGALAADVTVVLRRMLVNPIVMVIACIELCSGFLRDSMMRLVRRLRDRDRARGSPGAALGLEPLGHARLHGGDPGRHLRGRHLRPPLPVAAAARGGRPLFDHARRLGRLAPLARLGPRLGHQSSSSWS